jgi:hypothetical protein
MNSSLISRINTKTVTKLVLVVEILAISILHTVKSSNENKPSDTSQQEVKISTPGKNYSTGSNITWARNQN